MNLLLNIFGVFIPSNKKLTAKAFLAAEQRIPGLGNDVLQDILWDAGIDPRFNMREASETDFCCSFGETPINFV